MTVTQFVGSSLSATEDTSYLSTGLDSLANDAAVSTGAIINNSSERLLHLYVWLTLASADLSSQPSPGAIIRLIQAIGSSSSVLEDDDDKAYGITLPFADTNATHSRVGELFVPPGYFRLTPVNKTGVAFASSGNVMGYSIWTPETDI